MKKFINFCDLFNHQVQINPDVNAVIFKNELLTYGELDRRSTLLAKCLKLNGVEAGKIIALGLYNSLDLLVGMLGILKAGGAYLPIDPNYPKKRIEMMLNDANPPVFLTETSLSYKFSSFPNTIIHIDRLPNPDRSIQLKPIQPDDLAYIIYTSGSTGQPKGIVVEHRALFHAALAYKELHPARPIALLPGSISFDPSLLTISHALISGGTICLPQNRTGIDPKQADVSISLIKKHNISHMLCTPSFYSMLLDKNQTLPSLKSVDLCAENIPNDLPKLHARFAPNAELYNAYGPSEYAIGATAAKIYDPVTKQISKITVGKAFSSNEVYILDEALQKLPANVKGEICVGGPGLAKGYLNLDRLSAEKFIAVSLPNGQTIRLYRSGDLGRFLPDGNIEFLGRADFQVKILGHRVELGEIEHKIYQYPGVNEAVVIIQKDENDQKQLTAYFSTTSSNKILGKLKAHLKKELPSYMIPTNLIQMENWPYNQNGKIDREALAKISKPSSSNYYGTVEN